MSFKAHVNHAVNKLIRFWNSDEDISTKFFYALVKPHLEFGSIIWYPHLKGDVEAVDRILHRATPLMVPGLAKLTYEKRLRKMKLTSLLFRRIRRDAI